MAQLDEDRASIRSKAQVSLNLIKLWEEFQRRVQRWLWKRRVKAALRKKRRKLPG